MKFGVLQIMGSDGRRRDLPLDLPSLVVGRADGNAIIIDDLSISRRHARLTVDSGHLLVEDLGSAQGTFINGLRIDPNVPNLVEDDAELRFGDIEVRFEPPPPAEVQTQPGMASFPGEADDRGQDFAIGSRLGVTLIAPNAPVIAGAPWIATLRVHNRSHVVDRVVISVPDLPADWVRLDRAELALPPDASELVQLTIIPPRKAESLAGEYDFTVQVSSSEHQREASTLGRFTLAPFQNLALGFEAPRSKRDFLVVTENRGNEAATYTLEGEDADAAYRYEFELPAVNLQPGERRTIGLRVHHKTPLLGVPIAMPFNVHAESDGPDGQKVTALGQLALRPPLQKFIAPAMFVVAVGAIALVAVAIMLLRSDSVVTSANAEAKFSGVHMCDKDEAAKADARQKQEDAAVPKPAGGTVLAAGVDPGAPYFAQNDPRWGKDEYAHAKDPDFGPDWCGSTIEQCGCAMTSVATTMAIFGLLKMPDGSPLTPEAMNSWFNEDGTKTNRGWVSRGYIYGDVIWTAANELSGEMAKAHPGVQTIRFARTGNGSDEEIKEQLKQGRPIILEVPGHWIAAVGLDGDSILINDPYYRDRKTLDVYKGKVKSSVIFEPSNDLSAVVFSAPSDVRVRITDKQGRVVGSLATGTAEDAAKGAVNEIPGASYSTRQAWRDPSCIESAPPADAGTNQIILPGTADDYKIEVLDAAGKPTSITIHTYDKQGKASVQTIDNPGSAVAQLSVDPASGKSDIKVIAGAQPTPEKTTTGGGGGGNENPTVAAPATATKAPAPTPTPEAVVQTNVAIGTIPGDQFVAIGNSEGFLVGDQIVFSPGKSNEEENRIVGFGSFILETPLKFAHSPGETIARKPRLPGQGPGSGGALPPPVVIPPLTAPENLVLGCSDIYTVEPHEATLICTLDITGSFTTTRWSANGKLIDEFNNTQLLIMTFTSDGQAAVGVTVCNRTICKSTSAAQKIQFPVPGTTNGPSAGAGSTGGTGTAAAPVPTPPATGVVVNCSTQFEQGTNPRAVVTCAALFSGPSTSISWSAPGASPASGQGKTFITNVVKGSLTKLRVTATVCNFAICTTSPNVDISIGKSTTKVFLKLNAATGLAEVPLNSTTTFTAIVTGPPAPAGGTVQFNRGLVAIGPSVPLFTAGSVGFAQYTVVTGSSPLDVVNAINPINAVYSGGTNLFGSFSENVNLAITPPVPEVCNALDDNSDTTIDNGCDLAPPRDIGGGTIVQALTISGAAGLGGVVSGNNSNDVVVRPGTQLAITANLTRFPDCAGCIRQVYLGIAPNVVNGAPVIGPYCAYSGGVGTVLPGVATNLMPLITAPALPGIYYVRGASTLDYSCVQATPLGPPDLSVGRIVVKAATTTQLTVESINGSAVTSVELGTPVKVTVNVTPIPVDGVVELFDNGASVAQAALDASGKATFTHTPTIAGPHSLNARYFGYPAALVFPQQWFGATSWLNAPSTDPASVAQPFNLAVRTSSTASLALTVGGVPVTNVPVGTTVSATVTIATPDPLVSPATLDGGVVTLTNASGVEVVTTPASPTVTGNSATFSFIAGDVGTSTTGSYALTAIYGGTTYVSPSPASPAKTLRVDRLDPSIVLGTAGSPAGLVPNPIVAGDTLVLTATVAGAPFAFPSGGTVEFRRNVAPSGSQLIAVATVSAPPSEIGVAQTSIPIQELCPQPPVPAAPWSCISDAGSYDITAKFLASGNLNDSPISTLQTLVVTAAPVTVSITAFDAAATVGGSGKIDVTVSPVAGGKVPGLVTGTVSLLDGTTPLPGGTNLPLVNVNPLISPNGTVSYPLNGLDAGTYASITVHYNASTKYAPGDSAPPITVTVIKANTTVVTTIANTSPIRIGDVVQLRALVGGGVSGVLNPDPGGTVQFMAGPNAIGTPRTLASGVATLDWTSGNVSGAPLDTAFSYTDIHAVYSGNANLTASTSPNVTLTLIKRTPSVSISITPSTQTIGGNVDFSATVIAGAINPDGAYVQFKAGTNNIGAPVLVVGGTATLANYTTGVFPFDAGASYTDIHADYDGANSNVGPGSSTNATLTVTKASSSASLAAISNVTLGNNGSFTVSVTGTSPFVVQGPAGGATVQFYKDGVVLGSPVLVAADGTAGFSAATGASTAFTDSGTFVISAFYGGTSQLQSATTGNQSFVVDKAPSIVTLTVTGTTPFTVGGAGSLRAVVSPGPSGGPGSISGTVTFTGVLNGSATTLASGVAVVGISGPGQDVEAIIQIAGMAAGSYTNVVATYNGSTKYAAGSSTPAQAFTIDKGTPTVTLTNPGSHTIGTPSTLAASVSGSGALSPNGGTVTFRAGGNVITTATVAGGVASISVTSGTFPLDTGNFDYVITATFEGNTNLNVVTSTGGTLHLDKAAVNVAMSGPSTVAFGSNATITATLTAPGTSAVVQPGTATVTFSIGGVAIGSPVVISGGTASVTLTPGTAPIAGAGNYTVTATYNGSSQVASGSNTAALAVTKVTPTVTAANNGPVVVGSSVTLTATISGTGSVAVDGATVSFSIGGTSRGTAIVGGAADANCGGGTGPSGVATCTFVTGAAPFGVGGSNITVTTAYAGTNEVATGSDSTTYSVTKAAPTVTFTSGPGTVALGASANFVVHVTGSGSKSPDGGTVGLYIGSTATTAIATATVSGNDATFSAITTGAAPFPNAATYVMIARFNGNTNLAAIDETANLTVLKASPAVTVTGAGSFNFGAAIALTVNVTGSGAASPVGGVVTLHIGSTTAPAIGSFTLTGNSTVFNFTAGTSPFGSAGTYSNLIAHFAGNTNVAAADSPTGQNVVVNPSTATLTIGSSGLTGSPATTFTLTATVTPDWAPTGSVQFKDGAANLGSPVTFASGNAVQLTGVTLAAGSHVITATWTPSGNYTGAPTVVTVTIVIS